MEDKEIKELKELITMSYAPDIYKLLKEIEIKDRIRALEILLNSIRKKIFNFNNSNLFKRLFLVIIGKKPKKKELIFCKGFKKIIKEEKELLKEYN